MLRFGNGLYMHRGKGIFKMSVGWTVDDSLLVFKTISDAQAYIDMLHSGCNKREPVVIGDISLDEKENQIITLR